jgi:hypothetical protein
MAISNAPTGKRETAAARRQQALEWRKSGLSYRAIGEKLGVSEKTAYEDVQTALAHLAELEQASAEEYRTLELMRLDMALLALAPKMKLGDPQVVNAWVKVSESRRKLLGLDAPTKIAPTNPDGTPYGAAYAELRATVLHVLAPYPELRLMLAERLDTDAPAD